MCADMLLINLWNKNKPMWFKLHCSLAHTLRDLKAKQIQAQSDLCWSDLLFLWLYHSFTPSLFYVSLHLLSHENATIVQDGNPVTYRDDMFRRYLKEQYT